MSESTQLMCGAILLSVPTIEYGGYFLFTVLAGRYDKMEFTHFQKSMFRAGHAHAGVLVILAIIAQMLIDHASLSGSLEWVVRTGFPVSALLVSGGFFGAAGYKGAEKPGKLVFLLYLGIFVLAASLIILGIGLIR